MPSLEFKMVVQRGHAEYPLSLGQFEIRHLDDDGHGFNDKEAAHHQEQNFLFGDDGNGAQNAAQGDGAGISHEDLGRMGVEP